MTCNTACLPVTSTSVLVAPGLFVAIHPLIWLLRACAFAANVAVLVKLVVQESWAEADSQSPEGGSWEVISTFLVYRNRNGLAQRTATHITARHT